MGVRVWMRVYLVRGDAVARIGMATAHKLEDALGGVQVAHIEGLCNREDIYICVGESQKVELACLMHMYMYMCVYTDVCTRKARRHTHMHSICGHGDIPAWTVGHALTYMYMYTPARTCEYRCARKATG